MTKYNFNFMNSVKRHIGDVKNLRPDYDLPTPINGRWIWPFWKGSIFGKLHMKIKGLKISVLNLQYLGQYKSMDLIAGNRHG